MYASMSAGMKIGLLCMIGSGAVGCGLNMQANYAKMRPNLVNRHYDAAASYVDSVKDSFYSKNNRLLYYMDKGMVLHLGGSYQASNKVMEQAKNAAEELWTESVGANAASWVTTDNSLPYQGEDFEKVMLNLVSALNYIGLGDYDNARVEARQIAAKLDLYNQKYGDKKSVYSDDAFARWLAGRLGETGRDMQAYNDAWIDYKKALHIYQHDYGRYGVGLPKQAVADAVGVLQRLGGDFDDERLPLLKAFPSVVVPNKKEADKYGRVVFLHLNGEAPFKIDQFWEVWTGPDMLRIAYPRFVAKPHAIAYARVAMRGTPNAGFTERMEDLTAIAIQNLDDHMERIKSKAIARAIAKFAMGKTAQVAGVVKGGAVGDAAAVSGLLWNWGNAIAEEADKRSWITLPSEIGVSELYANPGWAVLDVDFLTVAGQPVEHAEFELNVKAGETTFVSYRTFR